MNVCGYLNGGIACIKSFKVGASTTAGVVAMTDTNHYGSIINCTATGAADAFGLSVKGGTYDATPTAAETGEGIGYVDINPMAIIEAQCVTGAAGTALTEYVQDAASTTVFTDADLPAGIDYASGGFIYITSGANKGMSRIITSDSDGASATVTVAFPNSIAVGDKCIVLPFSPGKGKTVNLTTDLLSVRSDVDLGTGISVQVVSIDVDSDEPANNTRVRFILNDHIYNTAT